MVTGFTDGVPNFNFNIVFNGNAINMSLAGQLLKAFNFNSDKFLEAGLTLYPPFTYSCSGTTITANGVITTTATIVNELDEVIYNPADDFSQICYVVVCNTSTAYTTLNYEYTNELTGFNTSSAPGNLIFDPQATYNDVKLYDPRIYCKPFVDLQFICNNLSVPIEIIQDRTKFKAIVNFGGKTNPLVTCFLNDDIISSYNTLAGIGNIPTSVNKWESFLTKTITTVGLSTIGGALGGIGGGAIGVAGGAIGGLMSSGANAVQDVVNTASQPTHTSQPSELAGDNIPRHIPKIVINKWVADKELEGIVGEIYTYGYRYRTTRSVKYNCRVWFDYCQTEECKLPLIPNLQDRETLQNAFNRGLTKWHYDNEFGVNANFNKYQNNPERFYLNAEDAQIAYKFFKTSLPLKNYGTTGDASACTLNGGNIVNGVGLTGRATVTNVPGMVNGVNAQVWQFKLTELPSNWQNQFIELVSTNTRTGYGPTTGYGITVNGEFGSKTGSNISVLCSMPNGINDFLNKTITVYARAEGGSYYFTKTRIFVDDVIVFDGYGGNGFADGLTLDLMYNCDGIMRAFRVYKLPYAEIWDSDIVSKHLL